MGKNAAIAMPEPSIALVARAIVQDAVMSVTSVEVSKSLSDVRS